jgi:hypothetical protein
MRQLHREAMDDDDARQPEPSSQLESQHVSAMHRLGLEDQDEALQYALMLSLDDSRESVPDGEGLDWGNNGQVDDDAVGYEADADADAGADVDADAEDAIRQVREYESQTERETREMLEEIRQAEVG